MRQFYIRWFIAIREKNNFVVAILSKTKYYPKILSFKRPNLYNNVIPPGYLAFPWLLLSIMFVLVG